MRDDFPVAAAYLWVALWIFWLATALFVKRSIRRQSPGSQIAQSLPVIAGFYFLFGSGMWPHWLRLRFVPVSPVWTRTGLVITAMGIALAVWARLWIGRNWSGTVTIKERHELIQNGPYGLVRHPIYSGFLLAFLGTAIIVGELHGLMGFLMVVLGWGLKARLEESFMTQQFGAAYLDYKRRVKALVPFVV